MSVFSSVILEEIIYKMSKDVELDEEERGVVDEIVEIRDYDRVLE